MEYLILPKPPHIIVTKEHETILPSDGFLRVARSDMTFHYPAAPASQPFRADRLLLREEDAVAILAWYLDKDYEPCCYLRSAVRTAPMLRDYSDSKILESSSVGNFWEIPAGAVHADEPGLDGIMAAAVRETAEELGFAIDAKDISLLGRRSFNSGSLTGARIFYCKVRVKPEERLEPSLDGSPFEAHGQVIGVTLRDAMRAIDRGEIIDGKTEIGIRRLFETLTGL